MRNWISCISNGVCLWLSLWAVVGTFAENRPEYLQSGHRIVFLGDSITAAGDFIAIVDARLRVELGDDRPELINLGLPSETCTGLSEPEHPFPRPNVHERLERALAKAKPDVVVVCYGMNDGIYYPLDADRFAQFKAGMRRLVGQIEATGAECVILSPPAFDPEPFRRKGKLLPRTAETFAWFAIYEKYDKVIQTYADWLREDSDLAGLIVNVHDPIRDHLIEVRRKDPDYALSGDGVHINRDGHRLIAQSLMQAWQIEAEEALAENLVDLCHQRHRIIHAAWLSHVGHKRPGGKAGLPLAEAEQEAKLLDVRIGNLLSQ